MKTKYLILIGSLLALAVVLGGCATGLTASSWPGVTADADYAFIAGGPHVYAVNLQTGVEVWRFPAKAATTTPYFATPKLTPDGQLIVGSFDHKLYSLNPQTGTENWRFEQAKDRWIAGVLVSEDTIYAANADYSLYALTFSGTAKWAAPFRADQAIWGSPATDGTNVYFGTLGRKVYAVNVQTGKQTWAQSVDGAILGSPMVGPDNNLYVGTYGGALVTLNARNGEIIHQVATSSWIWTGPVQDGTNLYVGDAGGKLYAFPLKEGGQTWTKDLNGAIIGSPVVRGNTLIVGTESGNVYFMDNTGENMRPVTISGTVNATPCLAGEMVLVAPSNGDNLLVALDQNGSIKWSFTPAK
jgi:outer membrane protein assembly factor BamB